MNAKAVNLDNSWYYTWLHNPYQFSKCDQDEYPVASEFVPMIIGLNQSASLTSEVIAKWKISNAHYLLGYNEPDYGNGHNHPHMCHPRDVAKDWTATVQRIGVEQNLKLVSPAVSTTGLDDNGKSNWLDQFIGNCTNVFNDCDPSLIEYIAFHDYGCDSNKLISRINGAYKRYNRKIWITEFACGVK